MKRAGTLIFLIYSSFTAETFGQTEVSGNASGTWIKANSPYIVTGDILISENDTLLIDPGVEVKFDGSFQFVVRGLLQATGTEADSIVFSPNQPGSTWKGINFDESDHGSRLDYVRVEHSSLPGIRIFRAQLLIQNAKIANNSDMGVDLVSDADVIIKNSRITKNERGIRAGNRSQLLMAASVINHSSSVFSTVSIHSRSSATFANVLFSQNSGREVIELGFPSSAVRLVNCTLADNTESEHVVDAGDLPVLITNSIVWNSGTVQTGSLGRVSVQYSNIEGGFEGEGNIHSDPLFVDPNNGDFHLQANSPSVDSGHPLAFYNDSDGTRNDMGAFGGSNILPIPDKFDFGPTAAGETVYLSLHNLGETPFTLSSAMLSDPSNFSTDFVGPMTIAPMENDSVAVTFLASSTGSFDEQITFASPDLVGTNEAVVGIVGFSGVFGDVSGIWTQAESPYLITGDLLVPTSESLVIDPGVEIRFAGGFELRVQGLLEARGAEGDSVVFTTDHPDSTWLGLVFDNADGACELRYAIVEKGSANTSSRFDGGGINSTNTRLTILNSLIQNNYANNDGGGIRIRGGFFQDVENFKNRVMIADSKILNNTADDLGSAISCESAKLILINSLLSQNKGRIDLHVFRSKLSFANNVVSNNMFEFSPSNPPSSISSSDAEIMNSIFWRWGGFGSLDSDRVEIQYCTVEGGQAGEGNIDSDPLFVDPDNGDFRLQAGSPGIDTGHPSAFFHDMDGSRSDMGLFGGTRLVPDPLEVEFGPAGRGQTRDQLFYLHNLRETSVHITAAVLSDADNFSHGLASPLEILPADADSISVSFHPNVVEPLRERLIVASPDLLGADSAAVYLTGDAGIFNGEVSGVWSIENSPYIVEGEVSVEEGKTLTINPGVEVRFRKDARLDVAMQESLVAEGTEDSLIVFTSGEANPAPGDWRGINLRGTENRVVMRYCRVEYATIGITCRAFTSGCNDYDNFSIIENCNIRFNSGDGLFLIGSGSSTSGCTFPRTGSCNPAVRFNEIHENNGNGIKVIANDGFLSGGHVGAEISQNLIANNQASGIDCSGDDSAEPTIINNTIYGNTAAGIRFRSNFDPGDFRIFNNIVSQSTIGIQSADGADPDRGFNDVWGNGSDLDGISSAATDISLDPLFVDAATGDFHLQSTSPAIDAGDPASPKDVDSTRADMGAFPFLQRPSTPALTSPPDSATGVAHSPTFAWEAEPRASAYRVQVAKDSLFAAAVLDRSHLVATSLALSDTLDLSTLYFWRVQAMNAAGTSDWSPVFSFTTTDVPTFVQIPDQAPTTFALHQNHPNPFNPSTDITFQVPQASDVKISIYNMQGQEVKTLVDRQYATGSYSVSWDGSNDIGTRVASGVYLYRMQTSDFVQTKKLLLLK